jgi:hypothetical protein
MLLTRKNWTGPFSLIFEMGNPLLATIHLWREA